MLLLASGATADALTDLRWAVGLNPGEWRFHRAYARVRAQQGNLEDAKKSYQDAITVLKQAGDPLMAERIAGEMKALRTGKS